MLSLSGRATWSCPRFSPPGRWRRGVTPSTSIDSVSAACGWSEVKGGGHNRSTFCCPAGSSTTARDTRHEPSHALGIHSLSVVYYLTDVDETTHCFSVVPEAAMTKRGAGSPEYDGADGRDLLGPAGTAILFNAGSCHAGRLRKTTQPRRTVHIYYGHATQPPLSEHTIFPRRLIEHADPHVRRLFRRPNQITAAVHGLGLD